MLRLPRETIVYICIEDILPAEPLADNRNRKPNPTVLNAYFIAVLEFPVFILHVIEKNEGVVRR